MKKLQVGCNLQPSGYAIASIKLENPGFIPGLEVSLGDRFDSDGKLLSQRTLQHLQPGLLIMVSRHSSRDANDDDDRALLITS